MLLSGRLGKALQRINPGMTATVLQAALKEIERIHSPELLTNNETFHRLLTEGVKVSYQHEGNERGDIVWLIDSSNPGKNECVVASRFTVIENNQNKRPDLVLFVNGMPLVVIELKNAVGIKKPDISILSEDCLAELRDYSHKNVALEVLKKLLNDELKVRAKVNLMQSRSLMEMLENAIKKYHNKILTAAEVIEELITISKEIIASDQEADKLHLSHFEYAFYTAVASNDSGQELMKNEQLRELAIVLTQRVRQNASIDWTIKESVRAKLKVIVKKNIKTIWLSA